MNAFKGCFPMGLGTSRFPICGADDKAGFEKSVGIVINALDMGVNYIDTAYTYSAGMANAVIGEAFRRTGKRVAVTVKSMLAADKTAESTINTVRLQLALLDIDQADFFVCWTINLWNDFEMIIKKGGVYDGALKLKSDGTVKHICASVHTSISDTIRIIDSGFFEGITVSYSLLNGRELQSVLDRAYEKNVGIAVMNPLAGGIIPQNPEYFDYARYNESETLIEAALRFVKAHPAVNIILSGVSSEVELLENNNALIKENEEPDSERLKRVLEKSDKIPAVCTSCRYCEQCPVNIQIAEIMRRRNRLLFKSKDSYNRTDSELLENINLFYSMSSEELLETARNPCVRCGKCERVCTQKLPVMNSVEDYYNRAEKSGYSKKQRLDRLYGLFGNKRRIGLYPSGGFADTIMRTCADKMPNKRFEWVLFNSRSELYGSMMNGLVVHSPTEIPTLAPEIIVICSYKYADEIYESLKKYSYTGIEIVKLHRENDVPWVY